jgi:serine/threonine protein phosphatase PrpC
MDTNSDGSPPDSRAAHEFFDQEVTDAGRTPEEPTQVVDPPETPDVRSKLDAGGADDPSPTSTHGAGGMASPQSLGAAAEPEHPSPKVTDPALLVETSTAEYPSEAPGHGEAPVTELQPFDPTQVHGQADESHTSGGGPSQHPLQHPSPQRPGAEIRTATVEVAPRQIKRHLPNAQVRRQYDVNLAETLDGLEDLNLLPAGQPFVLHLDLDDRIVTGKPEEAGQFSVELTGKQGATPVIITLVLDVIPDPRDLWENKRSDPEAPFWKPEEAGEIHDWDVWVVGASKRGRSHAHEGSFRDDDFALSRTRPGGWHVACVADGAGSSKFSRHASRIVTTQIALRLGAALEATDALSDEQLTRAVAALRAGQDEAESALKSWVYKPLVGEAIAAAEALKEASREIKCGVEDLYTTLLFAAAKKCGDDYLVLSFGVGDGGMAIWNPVEREVHSLFSPEGGEFAGQTTFLLLREFQNQELNIERIGVGLMAKGAYTLLMTDGVTDPMFPSEIELASQDTWAEFWANELGPILDFSRDPQAVQTDLVDWLDFWSKGNHDDRTLAVIHHAELT